MDITSIINNAFSTASLSKDVEVNGVKFKFVASSIKDETAIAELFSKAQANPTESMTYFTDMRARSLAAVIRSVGGQDLNEVIELPDGSKIERVLYLSKEIGKWPASLVNTLFTIVTDFNKSVKESVRDAVKYEWYGENLLEKEKKEAELAAKEEAELADKEEVELVPLVLSTEEKE